MPDGKPNLAAPTPKTPDGKPDLTGTWLTRGGYTVNITKDLKPGEVSFQPWADTLYKHRLATNGKRIHRAVAFCRVCLGKTWCRIRSRYSTPTE